MADLVDPSTSGPTTHHRPALAGRLTFAVCLEDLGELSFAPCLILCGLTVLSPFGGLTVIAVVLGFAVLTLGAQLVLRKPFVTLPEKLRKFILSNSCLQWALKALLRQVERSQAQKRPPNHWMTLAPYDLLPRTMLVICGVMIIFSAEFPEMRHVLGIAVLALTISVYARKPHWVLLGTFLLSFASITPLFGS